MFIGDKRIEKTWKILRSLMKKIDDKDENTTYSPGTPCTCWCLSSKRRIDGGLLWGESAYAPESVIRDN
jgi:hypothetical protein